MARIPVTIQTSQPVGTTNPAVVTSRSTAPPNIRTLGPAQPRMQFKDFASNRVQSAANQAFRRSAARADSDQLTVPGVAFSAGTQLAVRHGLGRAWVGCALVNPQGGYLSYKVAHNADTRLDASTVLVTCQNNVTADVVAW